MPLQTVEKWTLREIQEKMHGGGGPPPLNTKSSASGHSSSSSVPNQSNSSSDPPPPIPARRLASHPPTAPSGKADGSSHHPHQQQGLGVKEKDISESHSAPSSPTEKGHKDGAKGDESIGGSASTVSPRHSSRSPHYQRPKSVVVDMTSGLNYAQVQFENGRNVGGRPKAAQRRNTKYTSIAYQPENAAEKAKRALKADETDGHGHAHGKGEIKGQHAQEQHQQQQARQPTSPPLTSSRNTDHHHHHHHHMSHGSSSPRSSPVPPSAVDNAPMYDVPPPVPMRMDLLESNEGGMVGGGEKSSTQDAIHKRHSSDPFHGGSADPFAQDPFGGDSGATAWDDPAAFYDKPPSRQPIPVRSEPLAAATTSSVSTTQPGTTGSSGGGGIVLDEHAINSADYTGESSYEDTMEVLQNLQMMKNSGADPYAPAAAVFMGQDSKKPELQSHNEILSPDLNQEKDSYQFPTELAKYPLKTRPEAGPTPATMPIDTQPRCKEEPTLHTFNYSPKLPHSSAVPTSSSASVTRHESFNRGSSRNMPLPPLPTEAPSQQPSPWQPHPVDHAPPLPARTMPNSGGKPPLPGNHPSMRKTATTPSTDEQPPRLPPPNHPWGNKRHPGEPADSSSQGNPPLPPRKKDGSSGADMPGALPPVQQQASRKDDLAMRELIALGYSKAEIDRALKITRNDYNMAKMILQEFGGRH